MGFKRLGSENVAVHAVNLLAHRVIEDTACALKLWPIQGAVDVDLQERDVEESHPVANYIEVSKARFLREISCRLYKSSGRIS